MTPEQPPMKTRTQEIRILTPGDEALLERFLLPRREFSLFLLSNMRAAGLADHGQRRQGTYAAALEDGAVTGVAGHFWNDNIILQAPQDAAILVDAVRRTTGRPLARLLGPADQVAAAARALAITPAFDAVEVLFSLALDQLVAPAPLLKGTVRGRVIERRDIDTVAAWRAAMNVEMFHEEDTPELHVQARESAENSLRSGRHWVLEDSDGNLVSMCNFNAELPEIVQVGSVFTPPKQRSRGYARAVVAAALLDARAEGVSTGILFTDQANTPARRAYSALGFEEIGDYRITLANLPPVEDEA